MARPARDIAGQRFGRLIAVSSFRERRRSGVSSIKWNLKCDCGGQTQATATDLVAGDVKSCGCYRAPRKHGCAKKGERPSEYTIWISMKARCADKNDSRYGGRGITVCQSWSHDFSAFLRDIGPRPSSKHSIDRIDNERGYEPGNCRWATTIEQSINRRTTKLSPGKVEAIKRMRTDGHKVREIAEAMGHPIGTIGNALYGRSWKSATPERKSNLLKPR